MPPTAPATRRCVETFLKRLHFVPVDATADAGWDDLSAILKDGEDRIRAFYLAVAPELFGTICAKIGSKGLITPRTRVIIEKPIGHDLKSACEVNDLVGRVFEERQIYRIDHYLGKETVQNLMALRFGNALFEPLWNARPYRPRADHGGGEHRGRRARGLLRPRRGAARHGAEPHDAAPHA